MSWINLHHSETIFCKLIFFKNTQIFCLGRVYQKRRKTENNIVDFGFKLKHDDRLPVKFSSMVSTHTIHDGRQRLKIFATH